MAKSKVEQAQDQLDALQQQIAVMEARLGEIPGELQAKHQELGSARVSGSSTSTIHQAIERLEKEQKELGAELEALRPSVDAFEQSLVAARQEAAAVECARLASEIGPKGVDVYKLLDQVHVGLVELLNLHDQLQEAQRQAGSLLKVHPLEGVFSLQTVKIWRMVHDALMDIASSNQYPYGPEGLKKNGLKKFDWDLEFSGKIPIEREPAVTASEVVQHA